MANFTIGADPEIFLKRRGKAFSAHGIIPGTKKSPYTVENGAVQVDGMAVEFNINPAQLNDWPPDGFNAFDHNIVSVMDTMKKMVKERDSALSFNIASVQVFDDKLMEEQPDEAKELGCDPDFCAYTGEPNPRPDGVVNFRTAAGHIHVGWGFDIPVDHPDHIEICCDFIKRMDMTVGLYMTIIDDDPRRRELYGKAGAFRPKSYGVEYRTPSNLWLINKARRHMIYKLTRLATQMATDQVSTRSLFGAEVSHETVQKVIDDGDYNTAYKFLRSLTRYYYYTPSPNVRNEYTARCKREDGAVKVAPGVVNEAAKITKMVA